MSEVGEGQRMECCLEVGGWDGDGEMTEAAVRFVAEVELEWL